jgi:hypothetical protein
MSMQDEGPDVAVLSTTVNTGSDESVDWKAVVAGAIIAAAISFVLFSFGAVLGLSVTSPYPSESISAPAFATGAAIWTLLVTVLSFVIGGYFTGLLMPRRALGEHEREMRDGMHGALCWAVGVLVGAAIAAWTAGGVAKTGSEAALHATTSAVAQPATYYADTLLRSDNPSTVAPAETELRRLEVARILANAPDGNIVSNDRSYLGRLVARQTALPEAEAMDRVEMVAQEYRSAIEKAQAAADKARKYALLLAFALAGTLAISAAAAWWAAVQGGEHRDQNVDLRPYIGWRKSRIRQRRA